MLSKAMIQFFDGVITTLGNVSQMTIKHIQSANPFINLTKGHVHDVKHL
jgi:hypothetical protein